MLQNQYPGSTSQAGTYSGSGSIHLKKEDNRGITDYTNKCRVCLEQGKIPIFGVASGIGEAISAIASIYVGDNKYFPRFLCLKCHTLLQGATKLRKMAQQTDQILKQVFVSENDNYLEEDFTYEPEQSISVKDDAPKKSIKAEEFGTNHAEDLNLFQCEICKKEYKKIYFAKHMALHGVIVCKICKKSIHKLKYRRHLKDEHKIENLYKYMCEICGKELSNNGSYLLHKLTHSNEFPFKCDLCPYRGRHAGLLKAHMGSHNKDYKHQCPECPNRYVTNSCLRRHLRSHKEKEYKCDTCNKSYETQHKLTCHQQVDHMGIRNHICNICGKDFGYRNQMMKHQRKVHKRKKMKSGRMASYLEADSTNHHEQNEQSLD